MPKKDVLLIVIIVLAACLMQFASDIYTPSLPAISSAFHVPANLVKWTIAIYLFTAAFGQLIYGPISEGIGRKKVVLVGLLIFGIGTVVCATAFSIHALLLGRCIQGLGIASIAALWRPILRDLVSGDQLAKVGSYITMAVVWVSASAPMLGGELQTHFGWRSNFIFLLFYVVMMLISITLYVRETSQHHHMDRLKPAYIFSIYRQLVTSKFFMGLTVCTFLAYGGIFAWLTMGPFLMIHRLGLSPSTFGWILGIGSGCFAMLSALINARYVVRYGGVQMIRVGIVAMFIGGVVMLMSYLIFGMNIWAIFISAFIFYFGSMFIFPNMFGLVFTPFGKIAGYAGSVYGAIQALGGAVLSGLVSHFQENTPLPLAFIFMAVAVLTVLSFETAKGCSVDIQ